MRVAHVITRLIIGGAQENTLWTAFDQQHLHHDDVVLISGPGVGPEGDLQGTDQAQSLDVRILPDLQRSIQPARDYAAYRALVRVLRDYRPDIVHTHSSKAGILGRRAAHRLRIPCVHTIHGASFHYGQHPLAYRAYVAAERLAARWTTRFISVSDDMTAEYVAAGIAGAERFTTIYSGFDVAPFLQPPRPPEEVRRELGFEPQHIVVGKIARLFHLKGHEFLLAAAPALCERVPNLRFLLVGDGILRSRIEGRIASLGLADRFVFTGLVPPERIPELIAAMDIVVHTSQWEGLARVLPQALIAGKPVVAYDVGGAREVVIPGQTGFLLARDSVVELADSVALLAGDPRLRQELGAAGRARFTDQFRHETMTRRIREVYAAVLG